MTDLFDKPLGGEGEGWSPGRKIETAVQTKSCRHDNFELTDKLLADAADQFRDLEVARRFAAQMRAEIDALRVHLATARADALNTVADRDALEKLLRGYRLERTQDEDGEGYPLIDALTCGHPTVQEGGEECYFLADRICGHILALIDKEPSNDGS